MVHAVSYAVAVWGEGGQVRARRSVVLVLLTYHSVLANPASCVELLLLVHRSTRAESSVLSVKAKNVTYI